MEQTTQDISRHLSRVHLRLIPGFDDESDGVLHDDLRHKTPRFVENEVL